MGFCPNSSKDKKNWLYQYGQSLRLFWEVDSYPERPQKMGGRLGATIDCLKNINLVFEYSIEESPAAKFFVRFLFIPPSNQAKMWVHDVDPNYFAFPVQLFLSEHNQRDRALQELTIEDIASVIDGLLLHPAVHQHIESPIDKHEIRFGGGIDNPFLYLFQLRYQLCPDQAKQEAERKRLIELFAMAIPNHWTSIRVNELMKQPA